ncbi:MAG TPA: glutamate synthase-related protein [Jatrophihabitans sp.]|uniref:glutamate synthase-related protein n=1 Tax=Jatrophihabitans sp. TaxID=1932789 RepID=UPI002EF3CBEB
MSELQAFGFPSEEIAHRARVGIADAFPPVSAYGQAVFGQSGQPAEGAADLLDRARLVPPVFLPQRLEKLIELGREPLPSDVDLVTVIGGFRSTMPMYLSAFGSTRLGSSELGIAASRQAGAAGIPMVIGENVVPVNGYRRDDAGVVSTLLARLHAYSDEVADATGGVVVQQSTEDADAEVWNLVYSDPAVEPLLASGRLGFELKVGQGAKPGLGGLTVLDRAAASRVGNQYELADIFAEAGVLRSGSPGTFTEEILRQQIRLMRNNFPRVRVWVKLYPGRDVAEAAQVAWAAGADAVTVDGAEAGSGWAPKAFLEHVGLPLGECLARIGSPSGCLLASGRMWEGARTVKALALGATAVGLGRAALLAVDADPHDGLRRLLDCLAFEARHLISALGKYTGAAVNADDVWWPDRPSVVAGELPLTIEVC